MKPILITTLLFIAGFAASAQKLPSIQQNGLKAPAGIKIDGRTNEWTPFQAYNHNVDAFYTIANDADNLYLVVQAKDETIAKKIISGGIIWSITRNKNSFDHGGGVGPIMSDAGRAAIIASYSEFKEYAGNKKTSKQADSLLLVANKVLANYSKEIIVRALNGIDDVISVYNNYGIKSAMLFDKTGALSWELVIPLKYLKNAINDQPKFSYNLTIRGVAINAKIMKSKTGQTATVTDVPMGAKGKPADVDILLNNTDFWADYILVK